MTEAQKLADYYKMLRKPFTKLVRLRFLNPDGSTAFSLDNSAQNPNSANFISDGSISVNLQNGQRRTANVTLSNVDGQYDYSVNKLWFGTEIALDEGLILSDGTEYYFQQGVFLIETPTESVFPNGRTVTLNLVDKWAKLDGTLGGNLEGTYQVAAGVNIYRPIAALLQEDAGNGYPIDRVLPVFTEYYNGKTQALPDGSTANLTDTPYTLTVEAGQTKADVILGLSGMVNAWTGYDRTGALRLEASQDDILDSDKPLSWQFSMEDTLILGASYQVLNTHVYNDYIVVGETLSGYAQPSGRAENLDPQSDTNIGLIGRKTLWVQQSGFYTDTMCRDYAEWKLKRAAALQKAVTISCGQMFHLEENTIVTIVRTDKPGAPVERHLVMGFSRPLASTGEMTVNAVSVQDFPIATVS